MEGKGEQLIKGEVKPSKQDLKEAREVVSEALKKAEKRLPRKDDYTVSLGWTEQDFVIDRMDGTHGRAYSAKFFEIKFNTAGEKWKRAIKTTAAHEYAHTWHYEKRYNSGGRNKKIWQYVIDEAITQNFAEKIFPNYSPDHRTEHTKEKIAEYWPEIRDEELDRDTGDVSWPYSLYINKRDEGYPNWLGYSMSYLLGKKLLEDYKLEEFPELEKSDVIKAGNKVFTER